VHAVAVGGVEVAGGVEHREHRVLLGVLPVPVLPRSRVLPPGSATALRQLSPIIAPDGSKITTPFGAPPHVVSRAPLPASKRW